MLRPIPVSCRRMRTQAATNDGAGHVKLSSENAGPRWRLMPPQALQQHLHQLAGVTQPPCWQRQAAGISETSHQCGKYSATESLVTWLDGSHSAIGECHQAGRRAPTMSGSCLLKGAAVSARSASAARTAGPACQVPSGQLPLDRRMRSLFQRQAPGQRWRLVSGRAGRVHTRGPPG